MYHKDDILMLWVKGYYALGWRGWVAMKLLDPALNKAFYDINRKPLSNKEDIR